MFQLREILVEIWTLGLWFYTWYVYPAQRDERVRSSLPVTTKDRAQAQHMDRETSQRLLGKRY